jgi:hypothetical protein
MKEKLNITLDLSKINKEKIVNREYQNNAGETVIGKEYKIEVIPLKQEKVIKSTPDWSMIKTHFIVESQTKEEREARTPSNYIGEGIVFRKGAEQTDGVFEAYPDSPNTDDIPF